MIANSRGLVGGYLDRHIDFCMGRIAMLQSHGIQPIIVFDGQPLPSKKGENEKRKKIRRENLSKVTGRNIVQLGGLDFIVPRLLSRHL